MKTVYSRVKRATHVVKWPITLSETYTNLVCIDRRMTTGRRKEYDEVTKAMVEHGDVDVVYGKKWPINFDKIASGVCGSGCVVLVEGAPGVGKSTFAWEYCRRWARGEIGQHYQLVLLLRLRDPRMSRARTLGDLIPNPSADVHRAVVRHLECSHGLNVLIILEGFDELPYACRSHQSVFLRLISGELLPSATVMVTSRPWATETLVKNYSHCIFQHIEILGFTRKQIVSHIRSVLPEDEAKSLEAYISNHPQIRGCMYIPLNTVIVLSVFKERQASMPTTLTELYTAVVQTLLVRYLYGHPDLDKCSKFRIHEDLFKDLSVPHIVKRNFLELCQLAYKGIMGRAYQMQQSASDQVQLIFEESDLAEEFDNLGFMDSVTELYATRGAVSSYNFLHLTFQEFFAAIHISTMSPADQVKHFQQHRDGKLKVVLRFLAGMSKLKCLMSETVRDTFVTENDERDKYSLKCDAAVGVDIVSWMFEAQSDRVIASLIKEEQVEFKDDRGMLPMDYYSLGYCIVHSQCDWVLNFDEHQKEDSEMLVAGASLRPDTSGRVVGLHAADNDFLATLLVGLKDILHLHELSVFLPTPLNHIPWSDLSSLRVLVLIFDDNDTIMGLDTILSELSLESLLIDGVVFGPSLHHEDCVALARAASTLKELTLHKISILKIGVEVITKALVSNKSLERLELTCDCFFTDTAADCLAQFITNSTTLRYLELYRCTFTVRGLRVLAQATHNPTVHTKNIDCSQLNVLLNDGGDINELDKLFRVYPNMRYIVDGVKFSHNSTLEGEYMVLTEYSTTDIDKILRAYPECRESIQSIFPHPILAFPVIRGANVIAQTTVEITPDQPLSFHWEGHGFRVYIPAGAVSRRVTLCIQASLSGDYQLPDDGALVSGVYWLSLHPHVRKFHKKVTLTLQHCASVEGDESSLSFITAKCTQETLPYTLKPLPGGAFSTNDSTIQVPSFSCFGIFSKGKIFYNFRVYYIPKQLNECEVHITLTANLELHRQV